MNALIVTAAFSIHFAWRMLPPARDLWKQKGYRRAVVASIVLYWGFAAAGIWIFAR